MRKARIRLQDTGDHEISLTPMLDVVFIMLVFFIVTASFNRETGVDARLADSADTVSSEAEAIHVRIDNSNAVWIDGVQIDFRAIRANIERLHALNPGFAVVVQPSKSSTAELLVAVIDAARAAEIEDIGVMPESGTYL